MLAVSTLADWNNLFGVLGGILAVLGALYKVAVWIHSKFINEGSLAVQAPPNISTASAPDQFPVQWPTDWTRIPPAWIRTTTILGVVLVAIAWAIPSFLNFLYGSSEWQALLRTAKNNFVNQGEKRSYCGRWENGSEIYSYDYEFVKLDRDFLPPEDRLYWRTVISQKEKIEQAEFAVEELLLCRRYGQTLGFCLVKYRTNATDKTLKESRVEIGDSVTARKWVEHYSTLVERVGSRKFTRPFVAKSDMGGGLRSPATFSKVGTRPAAGKEEVGSEKP